MMTRDMFGITREDKIACLKREIGFRRKVYPRQVANGTLSQPEADRQISVMEAILKDYESAA